MSWRSIPGQWGVGAAGVGPRMLRDEPWTDWAAATPESVDGGPLHILMWPGTSLCDGYPTINDRPSLVAVTTATDLVPGWGLVGWWTDGHQVGAPRDSVRQVSPAGQSGISYLERTDRARWPSGRYEFHVIAGDQVVALTVCITRPRLTGNRALVACVSGARPPPFRAAALQGDPHVHNAPDARRWCSRCPHRGRRGPRPPARPGRRRPRH